MKKIESGEVSGEIEYPPLTNEEVRNYAFAIIGGSALATWQIPEQDSDLLPMIFMPLMFLDEFQVKAEQRDGTVHAIGHMRHAFDRGINGYPMFSSIRTLQQSDADRIAKMISALKEVDCG